MAMRKCSTLLFCIAMFAPQLAKGEPWVAKLFEEQKFDFGTVARGADTVHKFKVVNRYKQDIELSSVNSSCGCTSPTIENKILKTGDVGYIVATFNTRTFTGMHGATLTVHVTWNDNGIRRFGETQLRVDGNIRGDVVFKPGAVKFDSIDQGSPSEQKVTITYAGRKDWKVTDVRGASDNMEVELTETQRYSGRVAYDLLVRLKDSAPAGYFNDQLILVTNDEQNPRIPLHVAGKIVPQISVSPEPVVLDDVARGEHVSKKVIVRGKKPFKIVSFNCDDDSFQFKTDDQASERHIVEIVFDAKKDVGKVKKTVQITTDLGNSYDVTLTAYATVIDAKSEPATEPKTDTTTTTPPPATPPSADNSGSNASDAAEKVAKE